MSYFSKSSNVQRIYFQINKNFQQKSFRIPVEFNEIKILQLLYRSNNPANESVLQIRTNNFDQTLHASDAQPFFIIVPKPSDVEYINMYNKPISADSEYVSNDVRYFNQIIFEVYESPPASSYPVPVSDAHLAAHPLQLELLVFKSHQHSEPNISA